MRKSTAQRVCPAIYIRRFDLKLLAMSHTRRDSIAMREHRGRLYSTRSIFNVLIPKRANAFAINKRGRRWKFSSDSRQHDKRGELSSGAAIAHYRLAIEHFIATNEPRLVLNFARLSVPFSFHRHFGSASDFTSNGNLCLDSSEA